MRTTIDVVLRFLLAKFHMDSLSTKLRPSSVLSALKNLPTEIDSTYDKAMERIQGMPTDHRDIAQAFLSWIAYTDRALTVSEVEHATVTYLMLEDDEAASAIDPDDIISANDLSSMCAGLVTVEGERITLVHYTAETYLNNTREKWFPNAYSKLAKTCLTYLLFDAFDAGACDGESEDIDFDQRTREYPLLGYASLWWGRFAYHTPYTQVRDKALDFLNSKAHVDASVQALWYTDTTDALTWTAKKGATALHLAAYFGLAELVADMLEMAHDIDAQDSLGNTALMYAAAEGHGAIMVRLLEAGASINITDHNGSSVLHKTIFPGRTDSVRILLRRADLDVNATNPSEDSQTALMLAAIWGHVCIVELLLKRVDILPDLRAPKTALMFAAYYDDVAIVKLLLKDSRVSINIQDKLGGATALMFAVTGGCTSSVEALLDAGADAEITDGIHEGGATPLLRAIECNHLPIVRLFLQRDFDCTSRGRFNRSPLHVAAFHGGDTIVQLLLEHTPDLDVNAQDKNGRTALHDRYNPLQTKTKGHG